MIKRLLFTFLLVTSFSYAQYTVSGELERHQNYPWMILYELQDGQQDYIAFDSIKKGRFSIAIPKNKLPGMYRLVYDVKNQASIDFIFDNENVELIFNPKEASTSIRFTESENNKMFRNYLKSTQIAEQQLDSIQVRHFTSKESGLSSIYKTKKFALELLQKTFEATSKGKLAHQFIKANAKYYENELVKSPDEFLTSVKEHYFDYIDFNNKVLLNSTFIHDKINAFIFHLKTSDDPAQQEQFQKEAITTVLNKINTNYKLSKGVQEGLLLGFANLEDAAMVNFVLTSYLQLPAAFKDINFVNDIKGQIRTSVGSTAPNFSWEEKGAQKDLYSLKTAQKYVVIFWSSTCSHCLQEMPILYNYLKNNAQVNVIAIGLEDDENKAGWQAMVTKYPNFTHVYGAKKWENKTAKNYGVNATPSYYVLDAQKKVLAKPNDVKELKLFFDKK